MGDAHRRFPAADEGDGRDRGDDDVEDAMARASHGVIAAARASETARQERA